jgi:hypothetical protein
MIHTSRSAPIAANIPFYCKPFSALCQYFFCEFSVKSKYFFNGKQEKSKYFPDPLPESEKYRPQQPSNGHFPAEASQRHAGIIGDPQVPSAYPKAHIQPAKEGCDHEYQIRQPAAFSPQRPQKSIKTP